MYNVSVLDGLLFSEAQTSGLSRPILRVLNSGPGPLVEVITIGGIPFDRPLTAALSSRGGQSLLGTGTMTSG